ncbi:hypothetical protein B0T21DRAFT_278685 [Apiosordaria backusii]|uniref:Uncharacterized protein n=1 Tax=Apiosordaria backusii TaxID=314023 RepID=A0AA40EX79_9PEZI|nr:hypothetical protein B0T21DRAFT_278685 [Apiosordaria backusii]
MTPKPLQERTAHVARNKANILRDFLKALGVGIFKDAPNLWEFDKLDTFCALYMETRDGGHCYATVECNKNYGGKIEYNAGKAGWNVCFVGGRQYFTDPRIGDFSITFTKKDGDEGQGLTNPVVQLQSFYNWKEWDVTGLAYAVDKADRCEAGIAPLNCPEGPWVCTQIDRYSHGRTKKWLCGVPRKDVAFPKDVNWDTGL